MLRRIDWGEKTILRDAGALLMPADITRKLAWQAAWPFASLPRHLKRRNSPTKLCPWPTKLLSLAR